MRARTSRLIVAALATIATAAATAAFAATPASASHSWNGYHWATNSYPINLRPVNSFSGGFRNTSIPSRVNSDWNKSVKFANRQRHWNNGRDLRRRCPFVSGSYRGCDYNWGATGWAGIAQIRISGRHITTGKVKVNNYYGTSNRYRRHVLCQEVGHVLGLDHQADGNHSCMDDSRYGWDELTPNAHDYRMLRRIYDHRHSSASQTTDGQAAPESRTDRKVERLANGDVLVTFILWAPVHP